MITHNIDFFMAEPILMNTHKADGFFYGELKRNIFLLSSNTHLICFTVYCNKEKNKYVQNH